MQATLTFSKPHDVFPDADRPGLLRAAAVHHTDTGDAHTCEVIDLAAPGSVEPGLELAGFETIDLTSLPELQQTLASVREADCLTDDTMAAIRAALTGAEFVMGNGKVLRIELVVDDGMFNRRAGPAGLSVNPGGMVGANGHSGAHYVHGDQDVFGVPLKQLMDGSAPDVFRHQTPDGRNDDSNTFLLNLWIPLHAPVQPLALMDRRTLDQRRHQLRYALPVENFLDRDDGQRINDIWAFLHDDAQQWYARSDMTHGQGYLFDTLGTAHGAAVLAGEEQLRELVVELRQRCALEGHDMPPAPAIEPVELSQATPTIAAAHRELSELLTESDARAVSTDWRNRVAAATDALIRRSVEMRLVATLHTP